MPNGFYMAQAQPMQYGPTISGAGAPIAGLMGGMQQGMQMAAQMQALRAAEEERQRERAAAQQQQEIQALRLQAAADPAAMEQLAGLDPQAALQMQQFQLRQEAALGDEEREALSGISAIALNAPPEQADAAYERIVKRVREEGDSEADVDLPTRKEWAEMTQQEKQDIIKQRGREWQDIALGPEAAERARTQREQLAQRREEKEFERKQKLAEEGKLAERAPAIEDPAKGRKEFTGLPAVKEYVTVRDAQRRVEASATDPSAAGDLALIFNYMKVLDPGSTVREGEFATAQNAAGVPGRIRSLYERVLKGTRLNEEQRADFLNRSRKLYDTKLQSHLKIEDQYRKLAEKSNIDPSDVVIDFVGDDRPTQGKKITGRRTLPDGRVVVQYDDGTFGVE